MSCAYYSREVLALLIEDDLPGLQAERVRQHINGCVECRHVCEQLQSSQLLIKSRLRVPVQTLPSQEFLAGVREAVLSQIQDRQTFGWALKIERVLMLGIRRHRYAFAGLAVLVIISASLLGQMRHSLSETQRLAAVFDGKDMLLRPERYREWVFVGSSIGLDYSGTHETRTSWEPQSFQNVYVNPAAYREYAKNGTFPEGTVMVLERVRSEIRKGPGLQGTYEKEFIGLEASVKDSSRFQGGWGFFDFTEKEGKIKVKAQALSDGSCRSCHEERAETDHVFTQFYPVLRSARMES